MSNLTKGDLSDESYREYDIPGRSEPYRIENPVCLYQREGGSTHRVLASDGIVHCLPAPGVKGCVLRWKPKDASNPVQW